MALEEGHRAVVPFVSCLDYLHVDGFQGGLDVDILFCTCYCEQGVVLRSLKICFHMLQDFEGYRRAHLSMEFTLSCNSGWSISRFNFISRHHPAQPLKTAVIMLYNPSPCSNLGLLSVEVILLLVENMLNQKQRPDICIMRTPSKCLEILFESLVEVAEFDIAYNKWFGWVAL